MWTLSTKLLPPVSFALTVSSASLTRRQRQLVHTHHHHSPHRPPHQIRPQLQHSTLHSPHHLSTPSPWTALVLKPAEEAVPVTTVSPANRSSKADSRHTVIRLASPRKSVQHAHSARRTCALAASPMPSPRNRMLILWQAETLLTRPANALKRERLYVFGHSIKLEVADSIEDLLQLRQRGTSLS